MTLHYTLTPDDWIALQLHFYENTPFTNNIKRYLPPVIFVIAGFTLPLVLPFLSLAVSISAYGIVAILWLMLFPMFKPWLNRKTHNMRLRMIQKIVAGKLQKAPDMLSARSLTLTDEYLIGISDAGESRTRWKTFASYSVTEKYYFLFYYNGITMGFVIPKSIFATHPGEEAFLLSMLKGKLKK